MSDVLQLARENVDAFDRSDWARARELLSDDADYEEIGTGRRIEGADAVVEALAGWREGVPDLAAPSSTRSRTGAPSRSRCCGREPRQVRWRGRRVSSRRPVAPSRCTRRSGSTGRTTGSSPSGTTST